MYENKFQKLFYSLFFLALIFVDQISKYLIRTSGGFYICNQNLAFGIKFSVLILIFAVIITFFFVATNFGNSKLQAPSHKQIQNPNIKNSKPRFRILNFGILLVVSGAISNILDRLNYGCVIDFIDLKFWPVFNLADIFITVGAIMIIVKSSKLKIKSFGVRLRSRF